MTPPARQFDTLERPLPEETDVLTLPAGLPLPELVPRVASFLARGSAKMC
jgi:hypothetical protein